MEKLLSIPFLIFIPMAISFLILSPLFTNNEIAIRRFTKTFCIFHFCYSILMLAFFNINNSYSAELNLFGSEWIQMLGIKFAFKINNISIILTALTSFIFMMASVSGKLNIRKNHKFYYSMLMLLMSATLGIFTADDMFVFFLFWELELIPAYFLIGGDWGFDNNNAKKSAVKFVLFTFAGSMFLLLGILLLHYFNYISNGTLTAGFDNISMSEISLLAQYIISICFIICFAVKLPIIPLHTWLADAHTNAPAPVSIILAGIMLKTGAYGFYKFNYELMHQVFVDIAPILAIFALINIIYTAFVAYTQTDIKRIVAYSSISNMGLVLLGLCTCSKLGLSASVFHMVAHALVCTGLFTICGIIQLRCKTRELPDLGGIAEYMPRLFGFATLIIIASIGVPVFAPFIGEVLTIISALFSDISDIIKIVALLSLPLLILSSCYMLKFLHKSFCGEKQLRFEKINDISIHEFILLATTTGGLILLGLFPSVILNIIG